MRINYYQIKITRHRFTILEHVINRVLSIDIKNIFVATSDQEERLKYYK